MAGEGDLKCWVITSYKQSLSQLDYQNCWKASNDLLSLKNALKEEGKYEIFIRKVDNPLDL